MKAAYGLTAITWCQDVNALKAAPGLPVEPNKRAAVLDARAALATSASLALAGKHAESLAEAARARKEAQEAGHRGTEAEALFQIGYDDHRMGHYDEASANLGDAMATAYAAGNDVVFIRAASRLAFIAGDKLYHPADAQRFLALARAGLERVGGSEVLEADVLATDAVLLVAQGYPERAAPMLERVARFYRMSLGENPTTAIQLNNLGYAEHLANQNAAALALGGRGRCSRRSSEPRTSPRGSRSATSARPTSRAAASRTPSATYVNRSRCATTRAPTATGLPGCCRYLALASRASKGIPWARSPAGAAGSRSPRSSARRSVSCRACP